VKQKVFLNEMSAPDAMEQSSQTKNVRKFQKMEMRQLGFTISIYNRSGSSNRLDTMFDNTCIPTEDEHLQ
jgi:hypothetical protein